MREGSSPAPGWLWERFVVVYPGGVDERILGDARKRSDGNAQNLFAVSLFVAGHEPAPHDAADFEAAARFAAERPSKTSAGGYLHLSAHDANQKPSANPHVMPRMTPGKNRLLADVSDGSS